MKKLLLVIACIVTFVFAGNGYAWTADKIISAEAFEPATADAPEALPFFMIKKQVHDPRIAQKEILALINMDPQNESYRTDYKFYDTGVLLVPSDGPLRGKKGWYSGLAVPAGTLLDIPKSATKERFTFTAPNGETISDAVRVTLQPGTEAIVYACGNEHKPKQSLIMKMLQPLVETVTVPAPAPAPIVNQAECGPGTHLDQYGQCVPNAIGLLPPPHRWFCFRGGWRSATCVAVLIGAGIGIGEALNNHSSGCSARHLPPNGPAGLPVTSMDTCKPTTIRAVSLSFRF